MGNSKLGGIIRTFVMAGTAYAVGKGWISEGVANEITGAIVTLVVTGWSLATKKEV